LEKNIVVLDPSSKEGNTLDLIAGGFPITVVSVNDNFVNDKWDVALIKIDQANLPALPLGDASTIEGGGKIGVFGFPTTAELNNRNLLESSFTQGAISAIKDSENGDFKIIQTDAKISDGSSGGPLLNENGQVIGMITYQTDKTKLDNGDNFAFAIPIDTVEEGIKKFNVGNTEFNLDLGTYNAQFSAGLNFLHQSECKEALVNFAEAEKANEKFSVASSVDPYIKKCQGMIASNQSIDNPLQRVFHTLLNLSLMAWMGIIFIICLFVAIAVVLFKQKHRVEEKESEIAVLEKENKEEKNEIMILKKEVEETKVKDKEERREIEKIEEELAKVKNKKD
jgi:serine protease Do